MSGVKAMRGLGETSLWGVPGRTQWALLHHGSPGPGPFTWSVQGQREDEACSKCPEESCQ